MSTQYRCNMKAICIIGTCHGISIKRYIYDPQKSVIHEQINTEKRKIEQLFLQKLGTAENIIFTATQI